MVCSVIWRTFNRRLLPEGNERKDETEENATTSAALTRDSISALIFCPSKSPVFQVNHQQYTLSIFLKIAYLNLTPDKSDVFSPRDHFTIFNTKYSSAGLFEYAEIRRAG